MLGFSFVSIVLLYLIQRLQPLLPFGFGRGAVEPGIAFNTAVSFVTNTNWQSYVPEAVMGHTVQMLGLTVQNFLSAAVGLAVAIALVRGFVRAKTDRLGNFWVDLTRGVVRILLPMAFVFAIVLIGLGVVQSLKSGVAVTGVDGRRATRSRSRRPRRRRRSRSWAPTAAASSTPTPRTRSRTPTRWTNLIEIFLLLVIPVSSDPDVRHAWSATAGRATRCCR